MKAGSRVTFRLFILAVLQGALFLYLGYRWGLGKAFLDQKRLANEPEVIRSAESEWVQSLKDVRQESEPSSDAAKVNVEIPTAPFCLDVTRPLRITWPLDIGPDASPDRKDSRLCLRARPGVNEIQTPGSGTALYAFRIRKAGKYRTYCRVRWTDDGVNNVICNNSWFLGFDRHPTYVIGKDSDAATDWFWAKGPAASLEPGVHWIRIELREDGPLMDRVLIVPEGSSPEDNWDDNEPFYFREFADESPPLESQHPIQLTEFFALPTRSLVIGKGHLNEITVAASWQGKEQTEFEGMISVSCPTAPGLKVTGDQNVRVGARQSYSKSILKLQFPKNTTRRRHNVILRVKDKAGSQVFRTEIEFFKNYAWAILGPFQDGSEGSKDIYRMTGSIRGLNFPCDKNPISLAHRKNPAELGLADVPLAAGHTERKWRVVEDGSCYDWTGSIELTNIFGHVNSAFAYAVTWVRAEIQLNHRSFSFQPDDSGWLWVNGHFLVELPIDLPREANRLWTSAKLKLGPNPVVVKITQNQRFWGFRFDVIDWHWQGRRGDVVTGLEPKNWPTGK